ncbi:twin-arginine translocation signal domain-containing protein, partial [Candidatus Sumerlaeota bacterium]|nr:twin-arginine translocation signal domain-containing protein [Candidatus Sumerlaeota bacterium]
MNSKPRDHRIQSFKVSRRRFLVGAGAGACSLLRGAWGEGDAPTPPTPPRFVLEWGRKGEAE